MRQRRFLNESRNIGFFGNCFSASVKGRQPKFFQQLFHQPGISPHRIETSNTFAFTQIYHVNLGGRADVVIRLHVGGAAK